MNALTIRDLSVVAGEPRIRDIVLGQRLGFERPRKVRDLVSAHHAELKRYGGLPQVRANPVAGSKGGRPSHAFMLNEMQAMLICLFSNTACAADVREELLRLWQAYRAGELRAAPQPKGKRKLPPVYTAADPEHPDFRDPLIPIDNRRAILMRMRDFADVAADEKMLAMLPHLIVSASATKRVTFPRWFHDKDVFAAVVRTHRQAEVKQVVDLLKENFGYRAPSKSSLHRFWMKLDGVRGTGRKLH